MTNPIVKSQAYPPLVIHGNYIPPEIDNIVGPSRSTLGSILPFIYSLKFPDLEWLTNDPIHHNPLWPPIPTKIPLDIPKFDGKEREDPQNDIISFHLWCSSNNIVDDSILL